MAWSVPCPECGTQNEPDGSGAVLCARCGFFYRAPVPGPGTARPASPEELDRYWPLLVRIWPAYREFHDRGGERSVFVLEPTLRTGGGAARDHDDAEVRGIRVFYFAILPPFRRFRKKWARS